MVREGERARERERVREAERENKFNVKTWQGEVIEGNILFCNWNHDNTSPGRKCFLTLAVQRLDIVGHQKGSEVALSDERN